LGASTYQNPLITHPDEIAGLILEASGHR